MLTPLTTLRGKEKKKLWICAKGGRSQSFNSFIFLNFLLPFLSLFTIEIVYVLLTKVPKSSNKQERMVLKKLHPSDTNKWNTKEHDHKAIVNALLLDTGWRRMIVAKETMSHMQDVAARLVAGKSYKRAKWGPDTAQETIPNFLSLAGLM